MICEHMIHLGGLNINRDSPSGQFVTNDSMQFLSLIRLNGSDFGSAIGLDHHYKTHFSWRGESFVLSRMNDWTINIALSGVKIDYNNLLITSSHVLKKKKKHHFLFLQ